MKLKYSDSLPHKCQFGLLYQGLYEDGERCLNEAVLTAYEFESCEDNPNRGWHCANYCAGCAKIRGHKLTSNKTA